MVYVIITLVCATVLILTTKIHILPVTLEAVLQSITILGIVIGILNSCMYLNTVSRAEHIAGIQNIASVSTDEPLWKDKDGELNASIIKITDSNGREEVYGKESLAYIVIEKNTNHITVTKEFAFVRVSVPEKLMKS